MSEHQETAIQPMQDFISAICPRCGWEAAEVPVKDEVNGEWFAWKAAAEQYHHHFDQKHIRPAPGRVKRSRPAENGSTGGAS